MKSAVLSPKNSFDRDAWQILLFLVLGRSRCRSALSFPSSPMPMPIKRLSGCISLWNLVRTLVRRMAGSTSWRGRPLTLIRPFPVLQWATAYFVSIKSQHFPSFDIPVAHSLLRWASSLWETNRRILLLAEALNDLRRRHFCGIGWIVGG